MRGAFLFFVISGCLLISWYSVLNAQSVFFVSPSGDDANPGTYALPWETIQHAINHALAGDTVLIRDGIYYESLVFGTSGNPGDGHIVYKNYPGEHPIIDGTTTGYHVGITMTGVSYLILQGLEIRNWPQNVINVLESCHHLIFNDLDVHDFGFGITFWNGCHDVELNHVESYNYGILINQSYGFDCSYDITQNKPNHQFIFNHCSAHGSPGAPDNIDGFALGHQTLLHWQYDFTFNHCVAYDVYDGFDMDAKNTLLDGCIAYNCSSGGFKLWSDEITLLNCLAYGERMVCVEIDYPSLPGHGKTVTLQNCTFFSGESVVWIEHNSTDTLIMHNCILAGGRFIGLSFYEDGVTSVNYHGDYNVFHSYEPVRIVSVSGLSDFTLPAWQIFSGEDTHSLSVADPSTMFVDTACNYHLRVGSIAIDSGTAFGAPQFDLENNPRPFGTAVDIGAYEWNGNLLLQNVTINSTQAKCFDATQTIGIAGNGSTFTVNDGGTVYLIAGERILFFPGTAVHSGGFLHAGITTTGHYCGAFTNTPSDYWDETGMTERETDANPSVQWFQLYPNPTSGKLFLEIFDQHDTGKLRVEIYGIHGNMICIREMTNEQIQEFSLPEYPAGIYLIRLISGDKAATMQIIKQ